MLGIPITSLPNDLNIQMYTIFFTILLLLSFIVIL
jgi:hypothetical protein